MWATDVAAQSLLLVRYLHTIPFYPRIGIVCALLNFCLNRRRCNELEHLLQITLPCCALSMTSSMVEAKKNGTGKGRCS